MIEKILVRVWLVAIVLNIMTIKCTISDFMKI